MGNVDFQKQSPISLNGKIMTHNKMEISPNIIEISQNEMKTSANEQGTSANQAVSRSCRRGVNGFQIVGRTIFTLEQKV